jgi:hypothetical protein
MLSGKYTTMSDRHPQTSDCTQSAVALLKISFGNWDLLAQLSILLPECRTDRWHTDALRLNRFIAIEHSFYGNNEKPFWELLM